MILISFFHSVCDVTSNSPINLNLDSVLSLLEFTEKGKKKQNKTKKNLVDV